MSEGITLTRSRLNHLVLTTAKDVRSGLSSQDTEQSRVSLAKRPCTTTRHNVAGWLAAAQSMAASLAGAAHIYVSALARAFHGPVT
jgi:hypothetical protein